MTLERNHNSRGSIRILAAISLIAGALFSAGAVSAQPGSDIWLLPVTWQGDTLMVLGAPENVTQRPGYDNQPAFLPDGSGFLYTSIDESGQADVWMHMIKSKLTTRLTSTPESEFSPTPIPGDSAFSCIRVEADSSQRLWRFPMPAGEPTVILPDVKPVGYHLWVAKGLLTLFILGEPHHLDFVNTNNGRQDRVADNPGRSFHRIPTRNAISFIDKTDPDVWTIMRIDPNVGKAYEIIPTRPGCEDMIWIGPNEIMMSDKNRLMAWAARDVETWTEMAAFKEPGLQAITRMALSPDLRWLAIVSAEAEK